MLSSTDHDKLQQIIQEHPETEELFNRIFKSHQMDISTISHEIRNPLTLVYSTLQLIESQHPEVLEFAHWSELHQDIEYMKLLLEDLSSYNNGERLDLAPLSTGSFFRRIALSFASSIIDTDIEFTSYIPEDLPVLSADSVKLRQALLNLLRNAADAVRTESPSQDQHDMPAHSPQISLSVTADADSKSLTTAVVLLLKIRNTSLNHSSLTKLMEPDLVLQSHAGSSRLITVQLHLDQHNMPVRYLSLRFR